MKPVTAMMHVSFKSLILVVLFALTSGTKPHESANGYALPASLPSATIFNNTLSHVARAVVSMYWVGSELLHQHVVPVIRDQLWQPTCQFLREKEEAAIQRRLAAKQEPRATPEVSSEPREHSQPVTVPAPIHPSSIAETRQRTIVTKVRNLPSKNACSLALLPIRLVKVSLTAWILAEILDRVGILHEETPAILRSQVHRVWYDLQPHWFQLRDWMVTTWHRIAPNGLVPTRLPTKYQFAVGATMGMMASPFLFLLWKPALVLYVAAELNARAKVQGRWNLEHIFHPTLAHQIDEGLEKLRQSVSHLLDPTTSPQLLLGTSGGGANNKVRTYSLGLATPSAKSKMDPVVEQDWEQHRFIEMLRHGFVVGGLLGFMGKL